MIQLNVRGIVIIESFDLDLKICDNIEIIRSGKESKSLKMNEEDNVISMQSENMTYFSDFLKTDYINDTIKKSRAIDKVKTSKKPRKWSNAWKFFVPHKSNRARCISCNKYISFTKGATSNLYRHLRMMHPALYSVSMKPVKLPKIIYEDSDNIRIHKLADNSLNPIEKSSVVKGNLNADNDDSKYLFSKVDEDDKLICHLCSEKFSTKVNLCEHLCSHTKLSVQNGPIAPTDTDSKLFDDSSNLFTDSDADQWIEEIYEDVEHFDRVSDNDKKVQFVEVIDTPFKKSKIWKYFIDQYNGRAVCIFCSKHLSFTNGTTSNLARHLQLMHPSESVETVISWDDIITDNADGSNIELNESEENSSAIFMLSAKRNIVRKYFTIYHCNKAICNLCHRKISFKTEEMSCLMRHLQSVHNVNDGNYPKKSSFYDEVSDSVINADKCDREQLVVESDEESWDVKDIKSFDKLIRKYFNNGSAECNLCSQTVSFTNGTACNLFHHLQQSHCLL